jgi:hypothetical protein
MSELSKCKLFQANECLDNSATTVGRRPHYK